MAPALFASSSSSFFYSELHQLPQPQAARVAQKSLFLFRLSISCILLADQAKLCSVNSVHHRNIYKKRWAPSQFIGQVDSWTQMARQEAWNETAGRTTLQASIVTTQRKHRGHHADFTLSQGSAMLADGILYKMTGSKGDKWLVHER